LFNKKLFQQNLKTTWLGRELIFLEEVESTNTYAKNLEKVVPGTIVLAEGQTAGKGQHKKIWSAQTGKNLTFSLIFTPKQADRITLLTLVCASAIEDVICKYLNDCSINLKWPNDVMCDGKKIAGLLTEVIYNGNKVERVIVGIGLNVNQEAFTNDLNGVATTMKLISGQEESREQLLCDLLTRFEYNYQRWTNSSIDLVKEINPKLQGYGDWVTLEVDGNPEPDKKKFLGMNELGALQVLNKELGVDTFSYEQIRILID
jgi:BirA family transcriptional regulator, biotin operon repressor / biotin---[acetyl-CoA-carboxylase] ligase